MSKWQYTKGLHDIGRGMFAYLVPDGSWGWSNAGLIEDGGQTLLVDTLMDLAKTREMLAAMRDAVPAACDIGALVNTHANGDHTFGNQLLKGSRIIASKACQEDLPHRPPQQYAQWAREWTSMGDAGRFWHEVLGSRFDFEGIELTLPNETFSGEMNLRVGDKSVQLVELGPAHTRGDVVVYVPEDRVVFTGDIMFAGAHPAVWTGPVSNWVRACERILSWDVDVVVPGHGPITDKAGVREMRDYFVYLLAESKLCKDAGMKFEEAAEKMMADQHVNWGEDERLYANVFACYRELDPTLPAPDLMTMLGLFAKRYFSKAAAPCCADHASHSAHPHQ
jgi:cyclase